MPPKAASKRAAPAPERLSKRAKITAAAPAKVAETAPSLSNQKRWADVSASKNADDDFRLAVQDVSRANAYICVCKPPFIDRDGDEDDEEQESDEENDDDDEGSTANTARGGDKPKCDGGKECVDANHGMLITKDAQCQKPANENPDHPWILTYGGFRKWISQLNMAALRCPDNFGMYTFNDHEAYGYLEVCQNSFLDWDEATTWQHQWFVCEGLALFLLGEGQGFYMIDDGEAACASAQLVGRLFLAMLARLEAEELLDDNSAVKNLGLIMALYIKVASVFRAGSLLEEDEEEVCTTPTRYTWIPDRFDDYINAYANKFGITLRGLDDIDGMTANLKTDVSLPASGGNWGWSKALQQYRAEYPGEASGIGGDSLDITTYTAAERKQQSFDRKDPLSAALIRNIKKGMVMSLG